MRDELTLLELADRYLRGELGALERAELEERMRTDADLRELVEDHRVLLGGMQRIALRPAVDKAYRSYRFWKWAPGIGGAMLAVLLISGSVLLMTGPQETDAPLNTEPILSNIDSTAVEPTEEAATTNVRHTRQITRDTVIMIMENGVLKPVSAKDTIGKGTLRTVKTVQITGSSPEALQQQLDSVKGANETERIPAKAIPKDSLILLFDGGIAPRLE